MAALGKIALTARIAGYVDPRIRTVDITKCVAGAHARAIKPGGISTLKTSIMDDGYKLVSTLPTTTVTHRAALCPRQSPTIGVDDPGA
jgi:hypothetical protein